MSGVVPKSSPKLEKVAGCRRPEKGRSESLASGSLRICVCLNDVRRKEWLFVPTHGSILYLQPIITQYFIDNKSEIWLLFLIAHSKR